MSSRLTPEIPAHRWAFILENSRTIDRYSQRFILGTSLAFEDFRAELVAYTAETFESYDPALSGASTWLWFRAQHVRRSMVRARMRNRACFPVRVGFEAGEELDPVRHVPAVDGSPDRVEAAVRVRAILARATPHQLAAAESVMGDWSRSEIKRRVGVTRDARDETLRDLAGTRELGTVFADALGTAS